MTCLGVRREDRARGPSPQLPETRRFLGGLSSLICPRGQLSGLPCAVPRPPALSLLCYRRPIQLLVCLPRQTPRPPGPRLLSSALTTLL